MFESLMGIHGCRLSDGDRDIQLKLEAVERRVYTML